MRVEPMTAADWRAVRAIYEEGIATGDATFKTAAPSCNAWDSAHLPDHRWVARDDDGRILGWIAVSAYSRRAAYAGVVEESVYVAEDARGRGVGRALLGELITSTEAAGIWTLQARIQAENAASLAVHERAGPTRRPWRADRARRHGPLVRRLAAGAPEPDRRLTTSAFHSARVCRLPRRSLPHAE